MRKFNTTGTCVPERHYMVDISERLTRIKAMVDEGDYFAINRGRQYGKTTTLVALARYLRVEYDVISLDFQALSSESYRDEPMFVRSFAGELLQRQEFGLLDIPEPAARTLREIRAMDATEVSLNDLFLALTRWCVASGRPVVLIIDEVDSASNNQVFLDFLAQLRLQYLQRAANPDYPAFQSVILAGVTDIRHLRSKIRDEDQHKVNSPWNIAAEFAIEMSLPADGIAGMLAEYGEDHAIGMDTEAIAAQIYDYTSGYPFLVSRICQLIDERLGRDWTSFGVDEAVRVLLSENNALFDSLMGKLVNYPELATQLRGILLRGESVAWLPYDPEQQELRLYGFTRNAHNKLAIANKVFEMLLYVYFVGESERNDDLRRAAAGEGSIFVDEDGLLDVPKIMRHFIAEHNRIHGDASERFLEEEGRERFLTYLSPIINGTGTYDIEPQTRDQRRMDVVIHWLGRRYVVELKIWRGERYHEEGERQILGYLDYFGLDTGYLLSFSFRRDKEPGVERIKLGDRVLYEGTV